METAIFTTKKLEKSISKYVIKDLEEVKENNYLGNWNVSLFYVNRKKCWFLMNFKTKYVVVINGIKLSDIKNITTIFKETFYTQLIYDGIIVDFNLIEKIIGEVKLFSTNNNRSALGSINDYLYHYKYWISRSESNEINFKEITNRLNTKIPNTLLNYKIPKTIISELINSYSI